MKNAHRLSNATYLGEGLQVHTLQNATGDEPPDLQHPYEGLATVEPSHLSYRRDIDMLAVLVKRPGVVDEATSTGARPSTAMKQRQPVSTSPRR